MHARRESPSASRHSTASSLSPTTSNRNTRIRHSEGYSGAMSAVYSIYTSPSHAQLPNQLPTLIVTPHNRPKHVLYTYLHNDREANYLLTPSDDGDLCVAKLIPPKSGRSTSSGSSNNGVKCEASRNLKWTINNRGIEVSVSLPRPCKR